MINDVWENKKTKKLYILVCECEIIDKPGYVYYDSKHTAFHIKTVSKFNEEFKLINGSPGNIKFVNILEQIRFKN